MSEIEQYIRDQLEIKLKEVFDSLPWWCLLCGEGGNYEGERPDQYWFPPETHRCNKEKWTGQWVALRTSLVKQGYPPNGATIDDDLGPGIIEGIGEHRMYPPEVVDQALKDAGLK